MKNKKIVWTLFSISLLSFIYFSWDYGTKRYDPQEAASLLVTTLMVFSGISAGIFLMKLPTLKNKKIIWILFSISLLSCIYFLWDYGTKLYNPQEAASILVTILMVLTTISTVFFLNKLLEKKD